MDGGHQLADGSQASGAVAGRVRQRRVRTRARLLEAAHATMSRQGVDATTIQQITDAADVGFGTFYNYFASKTEVAAQVLDCLIHTLGSRNDLANARAGVADPVQIMANSVRLVTREMLTDPVWHWWVRRPDLLVPRMRAGFAPFGLRDLAAAIAAGRYAIRESERHQRWSFLIWLLAGGIGDLLDKNTPEEADGIAEAVLRIMGVAQDEAEAIARRPLPSYPPLAVNYGFVLIPEA